MDTLITFLTIIAGGYIVISVIGIIVAAVIILLAFRGYRRAKRNFDDAWERASRDLGSDRYRGR